MRDLVKAFLKTGFGTAANLILGAATIKVIAIILGANGVGLFSLLRQTQQVGQTLGTMSGQTALVQGLASREGRAKDQYLSTVFWITLATGLLVTFVFLLFASQIANLVMNSDEPITITMFRWLALPILLGVAFSYLSSLLNGYRAIGRLALAQVINVATMALLAYPVSQLVKNGQPFAFVWLLCASSGMGMLAAYLFASAQGWLSPLFQTVRDSFTREAASHFFTIGGTMLITGFAGTGTQLAVRSLVARQFGLSSAGIFDAAWTLSMMYVMLVLMSFQTYYLPTLSRIGDERERILLIRSVLRLSILLAVPLIVIVILLKPVVIIVLYSSEFIPALSIMRWMLIGDYFRIVSWVLAIPMLAYADMKTFFWTELSWDSLLLGFSATAVLGLHWLPGVSVGFVLLYSSYLVYTFWYTHHRFHLVLDRATVLQWLMGLILIVGASVQTWNDQQVQWPTFVLWLVLALGFSGFALNERERQGIMAIVLRKVWRAQIQ